MWARSSPKMRCSRSRGYGRTPCDIAMPPRRRNPWDGDLRDQQGANEISSAGGSTGA